MRKALWILVVLAGITSLGSYVWRSSRPEPAPLPTVASVDLARYAGTWYEIAAFPKWFQKGCHCTTATYTLQGDYVAVYNACREGSVAGKVKDASGKAFPVPGTQNAKLKVQFFWPFKGDYWILDLAPDYSYALIGDPTRESLWILARTPQLPTATYQALVQKAQSLGFATDRLQPTEQSCARN